LDSNRLYPRAHQNAVVQLKHGCNLEWIGGDCSMSTVRLCGFDWCRLWLLLLPRQCMCNQDPPCRGQHRCHQDRLSRALHRCRTRPAEFHLLCRRSHLSSPHRLHPPQAQLLAAAPAAATGRLAIGGWRTFVTQTGTLRTILCTIEGRCLCRRESMRS